MSTETNPLSSRCIACSPDHPNGLHLRFATGADGASTADWQPGDQWEGYRGVVHGGIVSTVLDEAMSKAVSSTGAGAVTGELRVRYRAPVKSGENYRLRGWIAQRKTRVFEVEASITTPEGVEHAHAWGMFVEIR